MAYDAGVDVSLEQSRVCVVDATGKIVAEAKVPSDPDAPVAFFKGPVFPLTRIGLEAGPLSHRPGDRTAVYRDWPERRDNGS